MATTPIDQDEDLKQRLATALGLASVGTPVEELDGRRRYGLAIGGQRFLLDLKNSVHVVDEASAYRLPNTRSWMLGVVNLRGSLVPLYDLAGCFELPPSPADRRMILVLGDGDNAAASVIDGPPRHVLVDENQEVDQLPSLHDFVVPHASGAYRLADGVWVELDWYGLFCDLRERALLPGRTVDV